MGRFRAAEQFSDVYLNILLVTPISTLIPLLVMSVGIGLAARIILVVWCAVETMRFGSSIGPSAIGLRSRAKSVTVELALEGCPLCLAERPRAAGLDEAEVLGGEVRVQRQLHLRQPPLSAPEPDELADGLRLPFGLHGHRANRSAGPLHRR